MRKDKTKILIAGLAVIALLLIACLVIIFIGRKAMNKSNAALMALQAEIDANKQLVYVASDDIEKGSELTLEANLIESEEYTDLTPEYFIQPEDLEDKLYAIVDIEAGTPILNGMVTRVEINQDTREYELKVVNLMTDQVNNEYVDVRIMFPDGSDYLILSKKPVRNLNLESCVWNTYMDEVEILRMASATIDAFTITGTRIYTTRYVEGNLQEASAPNYPICAEAYDLTHSGDPNVHITNESLKTMEETLNMEARRDLLSRLGGLSEEQLTSVSDGHGLEDTAGASVLGKRTYDADGNEYTDNEEAEEDIPEEDSDSEEETETLSSDE